MLIGFDPGTNTGAAIFEHGKLVSLQTIAPNKIADFLYAGATRVIFEDSRLTSHSFTTAPNRAAALKIARNVGEIDAWCKLIVAMCEELGIPAHGVSPKQKGKKLDAEAFATITGWTGQSNQHTRDAAMVAYPYRGTK